jgi:hypothetical protein
MKRNAPSHIRDRGVGEPRKTNSLIRSEQAAGPAFTFMALATHSVAIKKE